MDLRNFLLNGGTLESLKDDMKVKVYTHPVHPNLVSFKYTQHSPMDHAVAQDCRGTVLDQDADWRIVGLPFRKFFNVEEDKAACIDWSCAEVYEKKDGTLCFIYFYEDEWMVGTTGSPAASGTVMSSHLHRDGPSPDEAQPDGVDSFADLFWHVFAAAGLRVPAEGARGCTFMFELCTPWNQIIVPHQHPELFLLACREASTGQELPLSTALELSECVYPLVARHKELHSLDDITSYFRSVDPMKCEGFVVVDGSSNRVKVKHPGYVALHHLGDGYDTRRIVEIVRTGEASEVLAYFPQHREDFVPVMAAFKEFSQRLDEDWKRCSSAANRKKFELEAYQSLVPETMLAIRAGKIASTAQYIADLSAADLVKLLGVSDARKKNKKLTKKQRRQRDAQREGENGHVDGVGDVVEPPESSSEDWSMSRKKKKGKKAVRKQRKGKGKTEERAARSAPSEETLSSAPADPAIVTLARIIHGSADSVDVDVVYTVPFMPSTKECHAFCNADKAVENRNLIVVREGIVVETFKGTADEVNNALLATYGLHENSEACPVERVVRRDVVGKVFTSVLAIVGKTAHTTPDKGMRADLKSALRSTRLEERVGALRRIDFARAGLTVETLKGVAFQLGQSRALMDQQELYTKKDVADVFPVLRPFLYRVPGTDAGALSAFAEEFAQYFDGLTAEREGKSVALLRAAHTGNALLLQCSEEEVLYDFKSNKRV